VPAFDEARIPLGDHIVAELPIVPHSTDIGQEDMRLSRDIRSDIPRIRERIAGILDKPIRPRRHVNARFRRLRIGARKIIDGLRITFTDGVITRSIQIESDGFAVRLSVVFSDHWDRV